MNEDSKTIIDKKLMDKRTSVSPGHGKVSEGLDPMEELKEEKEGVDAGLDPIRTEEEKKES